MSGGDPYPPLGDYALIGDAHTAALVSRDGSIDWCCLPRFDSGSCFARLLDWEHGGWCRIAPAGDHEATREYLPGTLVLATAFHAAGGQVRLLDAFLLPDPLERRALPQILRVVEGERGAVELQVDLVPRFDYGTVRPWLRRDGVRRLAAIGGNDALVIGGDLELEAVGAHTLSARITVHAGERLRLWLAYAAPEEIDGGAPPAPDAEELDRRLAETVERWRAWAARGRPPSADAGGVMRSALTLKALTYAPTGAIAAAATTSLPEAIAGARNWDYRYSWIRDSSFAVRSLAEIGYEQEASAFRRFVQRSAAGHAEDLQVVYGLGGERRMTEEELPGLEGYRRSRPVRIGNDASGQLQLDAYGELVMLAWRWHRRGHSPDDDDWRFLASLVELAAERWSEPDCGLWEWRDQPLHFVHSKALCWAALERGLALAEDCLRRAPVRRWTKARDEVRAAIEARGYDRKRGIFRQAFDRPGLDAALLLLPVCGFVEYQDPRMLRTAEAIRDELGAGPGLLFRYRRDDGLGGEEGAFLACSFWLADCLAHQGRVADARETFDHATAAANDLGLFSEEWSPEHGLMLGNLPQALTHYSHIVAAVALAAAEAGPGPPAEANPALGAGAPG